MQDHQTQNPGGRNKQSERIAKIKIAELWSQDELRLGRGGRGTARAVLHMDHQLRTRTLPGGVVDWLAAWHCFISQALISHKPAGINKHFSMAIVSELLCEELGPEVTSQAVWAKLRTMFDLTAVDDREDVIPFPLGKKIFIINLFEKLTNHAAPPLSADLGFRCFDSSEYSTMIRKNKSKIAVWIEVPVPSEIKIKGCQFYDFLILKLHFNWFASLADEREFTLPRREYFSLISDKQKDIVKDSKVGPSKAGKVSVVRMPSDMGSDKGKEKQVCCFIMIINKHKPIPFVNRK